MRRQNKEYRIKNTKRSVLSCDNLDQKKIIFYICIFVFAFFSGCGSKIIKPFPVCPGKTQTSEALAALQLQPGNMIPLFTSKSECSIEYFDKDEIRKQHLKIRVLLIKPPSEIYMQASAGIVDKAVVLGSNEQEFWLEAKPDQISSYWWGLWSQQNYDTGIMINPKVLLEALGIAEIDNNANWSLSNEGAFDILTKTVQNVTEKKLHIYCCDYRVRKIEYYNNFGQPIVVVELDNYKEVSPGFFIPFSIFINSVSENIEDTLNIHVKLDSVQPATEKQKNFKIVRSQPKGFDHIYQVIDGQEIEQ